MKMRPEDFTVTYKWMEGSVPPPHHYEYEIRIGPGEKGTIIFYPDYPEEGSPVWTGEFPLDNLSLDSLYELLVEKKVLSGQWKEREDAEVGGELEWMEGTAGNADFRIPSSIKEPSLVESIYKHIRSLVPEWIWTKLMWNQQQYTRNYFKDQQPS
ncbi:hypothetical protein ACFLW2_01790 [Chloroflexota bacterium]